MKIMPISASCWVLTGGEMDRWTVERCANAGDWARIFGSAGGSWCSFVIGCMDEETGLDGVCNMQLSRLSCTLVGS